jgi:FAD dependent oxidoreductase TIGR03364
MAIEADIAVVGAGIVGLAHAYVAARRGLRVVVVDRDAQANGASIRNFGFVTVTGQQAGECWRRAMRSRDVWQEVAPQAGIEVVHRGLAVAVRRPEAEAVLEAFLLTEMGQACSMLTREQALGRVPLLHGQVRSVLWSPHEMRVESRTAIPKLATWLHERWGVRFLRSTLVTAVEPPVLATTAGAVRAARIVVCPGDDFLTLYPERIAAYGLRRCALQMLRVAPERPVMLGASVMGDLSLVFYKGYSELPEAAVLRNLLEREQAEHLREGVHLIAVQSADGSLVVGDSHDYGPTPEPFGRESVDGLILSELAAVLDLPPVRVAERWIGVYASAPDRLMLVDAPDPAVRIVVVTSGTGASTAFGIAEDVLDEILA